MEHHQEFWETLKLKYEDKNRTLQQREQELRHKLEAMDAIIGDSVRKTNELNEPKGSFPQQPSIKKSPPVIPSQVENEKIIITQRLSADIVPDRPDFKSCTCPPPPEKGGFFKCLYSLFGSSKPKGAPPPTTTPSPPPQSQSSTAPPSSPPAPQDIPTKDERQEQQSFKGSELNKITQPVTNVINYDYNAFKNANCMCNPCILDNMGPPMTSNNTQKNSRDAKNIGDGDICDCSICSRSFSSVVPMQQKTGGAKKDTCCCNYSSSRKDRMSDDTCICSLAETELSAEAALANAIKNNNNILNSNVQNNNMNDNSSICTCNNIINGNFNNPMGKIGIGSPSKLSLKSVDLYYMKNIHDLATEQKNLVGQIGDLERKAKIYEDVFNEYKNVDFTAKCRQPVCPCICNNSTSVSDSTDKTNAELKLENFLLKNELKDMRLEVRQYLERMEGPMQYKIESERYKCIQLEQKLEEAAKELANIQEFYQKEINSLKMQLCTANTNIYNLTAVNEQLKEDLQTCQQKCSKLEEDLIRQKISEAETIKSLQAALNAQVNTTVVKDECNLHQIARELSKILKECEPCGECMTLPEDLTTAAQLLKSLTDLIDSKLPKSEDSDHAMNEQLKMSTDVKEKVKNGSDPAITNEEVTAAEGVKETTRNGSDPAVIMDTLEITITQEQTGGSQVEEKVSSTKPESIHTKQSQQEKDDAGESQIQERTSSIKPESQSIHTKSSQQDKAGEPDGETQVEEQIPSVKSEPQNISSKKSHDSGRGDQRSERSTRVSEKSNRESVIIADNQFAKPTGSKPKSRTSCKCVKSRKSAEVDQIWPKADEPLVLKESSVLETTAIPSKKKCQCSVSKKLREMRAQQLKSSTTESKVPTGSSKKLCKCNKPSTQDELRTAQIIESQPETKPEVEPETEQEVGPETTQNLEVKPAGDGVDQIWPTTSDRFKLSHQVTASKSKDILKSETSVKCLKVKENFPFDIDTQVDIINRPPDGVHVTTTITNSGTLEVITEGPEGVIETTLIYTNSGNVEVVTEILDYRGTGKTCNRGKIRTPAVEGPAIPALEAPPIKSSVSEPGKTPEAISGLKVDAPKSGPSIVNPNCKCIECPGLEDMKDKTGDENEIKEVVAEQTPESEGIAVAAAQDGDKTSNVVQDTTEVKVDDTAVTTAEEKANATAEDNAGATAEETTGATTEDTVGAVAENAASTAAEDSTAVTPENTPISPTAENVSSAVAENVEVTPTTVTDVIDAAGSEVAQQMDGIPLIEKTLSLSLHVENEEDLARLSGLNNDDNKET